MYLYLGCCLEAQLRAEHITGHKVGGGGIIIRFAIIIPLSCVLPMPQTVPLDMISMRTLLRPPYVVIACEGSRMVAFSSYLTDRN